MQPLHNSLYQTTGAPPPDGTAAPYVVCEHIHLDGRADLDGWYVHDRDGQACDGPHETVVHAGIMATHWNRWAQTVKVRQSFLGEPAGPGATIR